MLDKPSWRKLLPRIDMTRTEFESTSNRRLAFRDPVIRQADEQARLYLYGEEHGQRVTREQKEVIEAIVATDYDGRTVIELLQNGHDAHLRDRHDGALEVVLDEHEGEHGVLYVANAGSPVGHDDFDAICSLGLSNKRPDEGIGNKGVGFKSVLQLADSPEIYSVSGEGSGLFDGYCLRFALPSDFDDVAARVAPERVGFADALRTNIAALKVPVPLDSVPERVGVWATRGFVTVVRLALRSEQACAMARLQIMELESSDVPVHLFLDRVARIVLRRVSTAGAATTELTRRRLKTIRGGDLRGEHLELQDGSRFLVLRRSVPEQAIRGAIADSREEAKLSTGWERWEGTAQVAVALPLHAPLDAGRLYTFLPMGAEAPAPFAGFANAPFFARLDRRALNEDVPLNDLLLTEIAHLCADAVLGQVAGEISLEAEQVVDLITWSPQALPRLIAAFKSRDTCLEELPLLPALGEAGARVALGAGVLWRSDGRSFTPRAVAQAGVEGLVDPSLDERRQDRLIALASELEQSLTPGDNEIATFAEAYASSLAAKPFEPAAWADFFDDLAISIRDGAVLQGREILVDAQSHPLAAGDGKVGPVVFVGHREGGGGAGASPPPSVASRVAFAHPAIPRRTEAGGPLRPGWRWLEQHGLVHEYRTESVLTIVGQTMEEARATDEALLMSCLRFAFQVWRGATREIGAAALERTGVLVPAQRGWISPSTTIFGLGWGGSYEEVDIKLSRLLQRASDIAPSLDPVAAGILRTPEEVLNDIADLHAWRSFFESIGVRHGLVPMHFESALFRLRGRQVASPMVLGDFDIAVSAGDQENWRRVAARWPHLEPSYTTTRYSPSSDVAHLPGQFDWEKFDAETRRTYAELVLHGLDAWPDTDIEVHFTASSDAVSVAWPSLVSSFLATTEWIPQTTPGDRATVTLMSPATAWWLREDETPDYVRAQPSALRKLATPTVLERLRKVGVRFWDEPGSAFDRLEELAAVAESSSRVPIRRAYEEAWRDLDAIDGIPPQRIIATRHGRMTVVDLSQDGEPVYVAVEDGVAKERLLAQAPVLMLAIRDRGLAGRVEQRLEAAGATRLRPTSTADVVVTADGVPAEQISFRALNDGAGRWLPMLVLGVLEYGDSVFPRVNAAHLRRSERRLAAATIAVARDVVTAVDGHATHDAGGARSFLLDDSRIVVEAEDNASSWQVLQAAAPAIAELVERPTVGAQLRLGLIDLERCGDDPPHVSDVASVLGVHPEDVAGILHGRADVSDIIAVLACIDVQIAEEMQGAATHLDGRDALRQWLDERLSAPLPSGARVLELAERGDPLAVVRTLGVDFADANAGWRALGLAPLHNEQGHERAVEAYVQVHRSLLHDQLRDRFAPAALDGAPLDRYMRLRELSGLAPDKAWLDAYWDVPHNVVEAHVFSWLDAVAPAAADYPVTLPPVDELRAAGRRTLSSVIANVRVLVEAWLHRHAAGAGNRPGDLRGITEAFTTSGEMDFKRITAEDVVAWLQAHNQWPEAMPLTTSRAALGLSTSDLEAARARLERDREQRRRQTTYIEYDGRTYTDDLDDLRELENAMRDELRLNPVLASAEPQMLADIDVGSSGSKRHRGPPRPGRDSGPPTERSIATGLAGEVVVGEWLRQQFGVAPEDSWQSGYRYELLGDGIGSDGHGYDFRIVTGERTLLIEVKSSTGTAFEFTLTESEVRRAQSLASDEDYWVVFVPHVLDPARRRIIPLPNPFGHGGLRRYRLAGSAMRLQFELANEPT